MCWTCAALFGVLPNTTFSQNVGLVGMTKIVNLFSISMGGIFLILCGFSPKLAALVAMILNICIKEDSIPQ